MKLTFFFLAICLIASAEIVDQLAISVGAEVITQLQIDEEIRVTAFLNEKPIVYNQEAKRTAADRLIQQILVQQELALSHYPGPTSEELTTYYGDVQRELGGAPTVKRKVRDYRLTETTLKDHLNQQLTTLRFVEYRFRPDVDVSDEEMKNYYLRETANWTAQHTGTPPSLEDSKDAIRKALVEERVSGALDAWLEETRKRTAIFYVDKTLQ